MKQKNVLALAVLLVFLLAGCGDVAVNNRCIPVGIELSPEFTVENNSQFVQPGEDAVFYLKFAEGITVKETDYAGEYTLTLEDGKVKLTLKEVRYPTRLVVELTDSFVTITYDPNMVGEKITIPYDTSLRSRPNTANSIDLFSRPGHTLVAWNTQPDGSGDRIGLGSRVTVPDGNITLYAQWEKWSDEADFQWMVQDDQAVITGYHGSDDTVVIPGELGGYPVAQIATGAFVQGTMKEVILPLTMQVVEEGAFQRCTLETLTLYDNIEIIEDASFDRCTKLKTLRINAVEKPYGTLFRRESCYPDKIDMLLQAQGQKKIVFYGGCSMWFNLDGEQLATLEEQGYQPINIAINGTCSSYFQMQILEHFLEEGDILLHTPEVSSNWQMMNKQIMNVEDDDKLWIGLEYNYDLVSLVDLSRLPGLISSFCGYLSVKKGGTSYNSCFFDEGKVFMDEYGCVDFERKEVLQDSLPDDVYLDVGYINSKGTAAINHFYQQYRAKGVQIYVSYACINMDGVPEEQRMYVDHVQQRYREAFEAMEGVKLISDMEDYLFLHEDYYDSNYHLNSAAVKTNTQNWLRDLQAQMEQDGLWEAK